MSQVKVFNTYAMVITGHYIITVHSAFGQTNEVGYYSCLLLLEVLLWFIDFM